MDVKRSNPDQYQLRFPVGMRERIKKAAKDSGLSMNAEIIDRLEKSFSFEQVEYRLRAEIAEFNAQIEVSDQERREFREQLEQRDRRDIERLAEIKTLHERLREAKFGTPINENEITYKIDRIEQHLREIAAKLQINVRDQD